MQNHLIGLSKHSDKAAKSTERHAKSTELSCNASDITGIKTRVKAKQTIEIHTC